MKPIALAAFACALSAPCFAQITSIGPFSGQFSEGFESFPFGNVAGAGSNVSGPASILGGQGTLSGLNPTWNLKPLYVYQTANFSLGLNGVATTFDGTKGLSLQSVTSNFDSIGRFDFLTPVQDFGAYWVHAKTSTHGGPVSVTLFDASNAIISIEQITYNTTLGGTPEWFGWNSTTPIAAVEFTGFFAGLDGLQINIPAPASAIVPAAGLLALRRRRR